MSLVLRGLTWRIVLTFLDDALVLGKDFQSHLDNLREVSLRFRIQAQEMRVIPDAEFLGRQVID
jgi:hypothetical protein